MFQVLRHYLPLRKILLIVSETVWITLVVNLGMSSHLWRVTDSVIELLAFQQMNVEQARWRCLISALMVSVVAQVAIAFNELYDFRLSSSRYERASRFMGSAGSAIALVLVLVVLMRIWGIQRMFDFPGLPLPPALVILTSTLILGFVLLYIWRHLFHFILRRMSFDQRLLILGSGRLAQRLVDDLLHRSHTGYEIVGMLPRTRARERRRASDEPDASTGNPWFEASRDRRQRDPGEGEAGAAPASRSSAAPVATRLLLSEDLRRGGAELESQLRAAEGEALPAETVDEIARRFDIDLIIVAFEDRRGSLPTDELMRCRLRGVVIEEAEAFYESLTGKIPAEAMRPSYLIFNQGFVQHPLAAAAKRALDILVALIGILLALPIMAVTALLIRLDSAGPILFRQKRTGRGSEPFTLLKFRSMSADAEKHTGPVWASKDDPRITRIGRIIRASRIDELPQLFNVLGGSMSMVGPRPERPTFVEDLTQKIPYYHQRHIVKPGVTGWAQINYPYGNTMEDALQKLQYDLFYIKYQSLIFDLSVLFNTVKTVVLRKGT